MILNLKAYLESGILELYALELLSKSQAEEVDKLLAIHSELGQELELIYMAIEKYAKSSAVAPLPHIRKRVIDSVQNLQKEKEMDLNDLPLITKHSDYKAWLKLIENFKAFPLDQNGRFMKVLRQDESTTQILVVSASDIEEEIHYDEYESFLILAGECKCTISDQVRIMGAGDFMAIPLHETHDVQIISPTVTAILQRIKR